MDPAAEWAQDAQAPVTQLVPEALDDDPAVGREGPRHVPLVLEIREEIVGGTLVQVVLVAQPGRGDRPAP